MLAIIAIIVFCIVHNRKQKEAAATDGSNVEMAKMPKDNSKSSAAAAAGGDKPKKQGKKKDDSADGESSSSSSDGKAMKQFLASHDPDEKPTNKHLAGAVDDKKYIVWPLLFG